MYQALYRKYRPRRFGDVAGQEHITETLRRQIALGRLSHAYLFVGTRGTGKTTCAKILARAVNCLSPEDGEPCNKCAACIGIENGSILDVLELDAASNNGVDNVRALREEAIYSPASVRMRVYIIDEVHMLSTAAFNALLKILEEPPEHLMFILATTELHKVPATILSRCQRFSFKRISPAAIAARLQSLAISEGLTLTEDAAEKLAALGDGSMRDALSLLDQCASDTNVDMQRVLDTIGLAGQQDIISLAAAAASRDTVAALSILDRLYDDGRDMPALLSELASIMRDILLHKLSKDSPLLSGAFSGEELSGLSAKLASERLFAFLDVIREAQLILSRGGSVKLTVEMCLIRMCDERLSDDYPALLSRIARLEEKKNFAQVDPTIESETGSCQSNGFTYYTKCHSERSEESQCVAVQELQDSSVVTSRKRDDTSSERHVYEDAQLSTVNCQPEEVELDSSNQTPDEDGIKDDGTVKPGTGGFWYEILQLLKDAPMLYAVLSNDARIQAELQDGTLLIRAGDEFTVSQIESKMFAEPLKKAAFEVIGREVIIKAVTGGGSYAENTRDKLNDLSAFDIVKFEKGRD